MPSKFEVLAEDEVALKALDIFVHFFVNPLFTKSGTQREVQAVDSENSKNKSTDGRRRLQILKALADQDHHWSKFTTGDRHTLPAADVEDTAYGDEIPSQSNDPQLQRIIEEINGGAKCTKRDEANLVREAVLAFHKRHYYPERMVAVLVGPQPVETSSSSGRNSQSLSCTAINKHSLLCAGHPSIIALSYFQCNL